MVKQAISLIRGGDFHGNAGRNATEGNLGHSRNERRAFVGSLFIVGLWICVFASTAAADDAKPLIKRLDDATRAKVLAALAGLIILGFAMVLLTWLGARITQRFRHSSAVFRPTPRPGEHEWARKKLPEDDS